MQAVSLSDTTLHWRP